VATAIVSALARGTLEPATVESALARIQRLRARLAGFSE